MNTLRWLPAAGIVSYEASYSDDAGVTWTVLAVVLNDQNPSRYDPLEEELFCRDPDGGSTRLYRLRAYDGASYSGYTASRTATGKPPTCLIYGRVTDLGGVDDEGAPVRATVLSTDASGAGQFAGNIGVASAEITTYCDRDGNWELELLQNSNVIIDIPSINLHKQIRIPAAAAADLLTLM